MHPSPASLKEQWLFPLERNAIALGMEPDSVGVSRRRLDVGTVMQPEVGFAAPRRYADGFQMRSLDVLGRAET